MTIIHQDIKSAFKNWLNNHKKNILLCIVSIVFCELIYVSVRFFSYKEKPDVEFRVNELTKLKKTVRKVQTSSKNKYSEYANVQDLYRKAQSIMKKDSISKADYVQLKLIDSTMRTLIKKN